MEFEFCKVEVCVYILEGLWIVLDNIDVIIKLICGLKIFDVVKEGLMI